LKLRVLAPGKVNLCLFIGPMRADGRHELLTLFESVSLADQLTMVTDVARDEVVCPAVQGSNLVDAALEGLRKRGWEGPPVRIEIDKRIPIAAGMGGGSSDAAAALRLAVELAPGRPEEVWTLATDLGADVPGQLAPGLVVGRGAGELVEPVRPLANHSFVIVPLEARLSTADVYREADRLGLPRDRAQLDPLYDQLRSALGVGSTLPDELLVNDLERAAVSLCPAIKRTLADVRAAGADRAFVCGSGPTVAGLYWHPDGAAAAASELVGRHPDLQPVVPVGAEFGMPVTV